MIIRHNIISSHALNKLKIKNNAAGKLIKQLSSGLRVNGASDDAASLAISEKMRAQIRGLNQAARNAQDGISLIQTAEGAMESIHESLQRMRELCVLGANDTLTNSDRNSVQKELDQLKESINNISSTTKFNGISLLDGKMSSSGVPLTSSITPNVNIPDDGTISIVSIEIDGQVLDFEFSKSEDLLNIVVKNNGTIIGNKSINTSSTVQWSKTFGGASSDYANEVFQTEDGGYIAVGTIYTGGLFEKQAVIIKTDKDGNQEWTREIGYLDSDEGSSIVETEDGSFAVTGSYLDHTAGHHLGELLFAKFQSDAPPHSYDVFEIFEGNGIDHGQCIRQTSDGGFIIAGYSNSTSGDEKVSENKGGKDIWVVKLNSSGQLIWEKSFGGSSDEEAFSVQQTSDGGFIISGNTRSNDGDVTGYHGNTDCWVIKQDSDGGLQWEKTLGGNAYETANSVIQTEDGGFIVAGYTSSANGDVTKNHGDRDGWLVKLNSEGEIVWQKTLGGSLDDELYDIRRTSDGGYILAGSTRSTDGDVSKNNGYYDTWIVKIDTNGDIEWQKTFGGSKKDVLKSVSQTDDGGYIVSGHTFSDDGDILFNNGDSDFYIAKLSGVDSDITLNLKDIIDGQTLIRFTDVHVAFDSQALNTVTNIDINAKKIVKSGLTLQVGANEGQTVDIYISDLSAEGIGLTDGYPKLIPPGEAEKSIQLLDNAIKTVSSERSNCGSMQNRLENIIVNLDNTSENLTSSESRIRDLDMAKAVMEMVKNNVLTQSAQAMLAQSNKVPESVLQLLK